MIYNEIISVMIALLDFRQLIALDADGGSDERAGDKDVLQTCGVANLPRLVVDGIRAAKYTVDGGAEG